MGIEHTECRKLRYEMRSEIENIIKEKHIDRAVFYEAGKGEFVLREYPMTMDDFYMTPKDFSWLVVHCDDGACICKMWNAAGKK